MTDKLPLHQSNSDPEKERAITALLAAVAEAQRVEMDKEEINTVVEEALRGV